MSLEELFLQSTIIDLTHCLDENIPTWSDDTMPFKRQMIVDYDYKGFRCFTFSQSEGVGTHMDAPAHFSQNGKTIEELKCSTLVAPITVIDVRNKVATDNDYKIRVEDILRWEEVNGLIAENSLVLGLTGWDKYWDDKDRYLNQDDANIMHYPGYSKEAAQMLVKRNIAGIGLDTLSIDGGEAEEFAAHKIILGNDKYQLENLKNLDKLPKKGAIGIALPIKIRGGAEAPARVIAVIPDNLNPK